MAKVELDGGELMDSLTLSLRMPKAFGLRMWLVGRLVWFACQVSPFKVKVALLDEGEALQLDGHMHRIDVRPDDKFVLKSDRPISAEQADRMRAAFKRFAGSDVDLLVLDPGLTLSIMRGGLGWRDSSQGDDNPASDR